MKTTVTPGYDGLTDWPTSELLDANYDIMWSPFFVDPNGYEDSRWDTAQAELDHICIVTMTGGFAYED